MEWISVKDKFPDKYEDVILYAPKFPEDYCPKESHIFVGYLTGQIDADMDRREWDCVWGDNWVPFEFEDITHWMPLPKPPEE